MSSVQQAPSTLQAGPVEGTRCAARELNDRAYHLRGFLEERFRPGPGRIVLTIDPTDDELIKDTGWSKSKVRRAIDDLVDEKYLRRDRRRGRRYLTRRYVAAANPVHDMVRSGYRDGLPRPMHADRTPIEFEIPKNGDPTSSDPPRVHASPDDDDARFAPGEEPREQTELAAGAIEAIALAKAEPELGPAAAAAIRADATRFDRELEGRWDWFVTALCFVIVAQRRAKNGKRESIDNPVSYAMGTACRNENSYRAKGGPDDAGRKAEAEVKRRAVARRAELARQAAARAGPEPEPPPSDEQVRKWREDACLPRSDGRRVIARFNLANHDLPIGELEGVAP